MSNVQNMQGGNQGGNNMQGMIPNIMSGNALQNNNMLPMGQNIPLNMNIMNQNMMMPNPNTRNNNGNNNGNNYNNKKYHNQGNKQNYKPKQKVREQTQDAESKELNHQSAVKCNSQLANINLKNVVIPNNAKFFVIKSYSEDNIIMSIK